MTAPTPPPYSPLPPPPGLRWRTVAAILAILLLAAIIAVVALLVEGDSDDDSHAGDRAEAACDLVEDLPDPLPPEDFSTEEPLLWELQAIGPLATAAAMGADAYADLGEAGQQLYAAIARLDEDLLNDVVDDLRSECEDID